MTEIIKNPNGTYAVYDGNELISDGWTRRGYAEQSRGGRREGAGRKPRNTPRKTISVKIEPEDAEKFRKLCAANQRSQAQQVTEWIRHEFYESTENQETHA